MITLIDVIENKYDLYEGDLKYYYRIFWDHATNLELQYHNYRHTMHVLYQCYDGAHWHREDLNKSLIRCLLIAAIFHDFNHSGTPGHDDLKVQIAIRELEKYILATDMPQIETIKRLINTTEYPNKSSADDLLEGIIRDADASQALCGSWIQQVIFGLSSEWRCDRLQVFKMQEKFLGSIKWNTDWADMKFPNYTIKAKIDEAKAHIRLLS